MPPMTSARLLDHLVMPTASLGVARERLTALGFTVAPDGVHPFGTANCCVYFSDGTFIEPLVVADREEADRAIRLGNVFVARDRQFRELAGDEGLSALVLRADDALADHRRFEHDGISAGPVLDFSRPFVDRSGKSDIASFRLAFAAEEPSDETFFFTCQRVHAPAVDRSALQRHPNGATRFDRIVLSSSAPVEHVPFLTDLLGSEPVADADDAIFFRLGEVELAVLGQEAEEGDAGEAQLRVRALKFRCGDVDGLAAALTKAGIDHDIADGRCIVPPAAGQGVFFIFESDR